MGSSGTCAGLVGDSPSGLQQHTWKKSQNGGRAVVGGRTIQLCAQEQLLVKIWGKTVRFIHRPRSRRDRALAGPAAASAPRTKGAQSAGSWGQGRRIFNAFNDG